MLGRLVSSIGVKRIIFYGETRLEKLLNASLILTAFIAVIATIVAFVVEPPRKFLSCIFFNFVFVAWLLHLRNLYFEEGEKYREMRREAIEAGMSEQEASQYILCVKECDIIKSWVLCIVLLSLIMFFVYYIIP